jgi:streptogramin lyase
MTGPASRARRPQPFRPISRAYEAADQQRVSVRARKRPDGNTWVDPFGIAAQNSDDIARINISTGVATAFPIPSANSDVYGFTADSTYLWFTEPGNNLTGYTNKARSGSPRQTPIR